MISGRMLLVGSKLSFDRLRWLVMLLTVVTSARLSAQAVSIDLPGPTATLRQHQFSRIISVRELADGRVLVSDPVERRLALVDFRLGQVSTVGSIGDGPGEYRSPGYLYGLSGDSTIFTDPTTHRALLLVGQRVVETMSLAGELLVRFGADPPQGIDRAGRLLGVEGFAFPPEMPPMSRTFADSLTILLTIGSVFDDEARGLDTIAAVGGQGRFGVKRVPRSVFREGEGGFSIITSPLASEAQTWLFPDGSIAVAHPDPYRVDWRTPEGVWTRGVPLPHATVRVDREEQCFVLARRLHPSSGECKPEAWPWPDYIPPFVMEVPWTSPGGIALQPAPNGMLLIARTITSQSPGRRYDVVDRGGALHAVVRVAKEQTIIGSGRSSLYVVHKDSMDLLTISRHPWPF